MTDIYKIAVSLSMTGNAAAFMSVLAQRVLHVHASVAKLQGGLTNLSRTKLAIGGGLSIAGGAAILTTLAKITDHAKELSHELVQLKKLNITMPQLSEVRSSALNVTRQVGGVTEIDALKTYGSAFSIFGHTDALKLMKPLAEFAQVAGNTTGNYDKAADSVYAMIRAGDLMGKFVDETTHKLDTAKLTAFLNLGSRVTLGTHGKVSSETWLALAQQGGPALSGMSDQGLLTMAIASQAMGGPRAGTALTSLYQQMIGGKMTKPVAEQLRALGLVGDFDVGKGGHLTWHKGALDNSFTRSLKEDPLAAVSLMQEALKKHGYDTIEKQVPMLFEILGRQTTQRLVHDLLRNLPQILGERERIGSALGIGSSLKIQNSEDLVQVEKNLKAAWENLLLAVAGPNAENAIGVLNKITGALNWMTEVVRGMKPETLQLIGEGLFGLGVALVGGGAVAIIATLGAIGGFAAIAVGISAALIRYKDTIAAFSTALDAEIASWPGKLAATISAMGEGIVNLIKGAFQSLLGGLRSILPGGPATGPTAPPGQGSFDAMGNYSPTSYSAEGVGALIHKAAATSGSGEAANDNAVSRSVYRGVVEALRDFGGTGGGTGASSGGGFGGGGGGSGISRASFGGGGFGAADNSSIAAATSAAGGSSFGGLGSSGSAVDVASRYLGMHEVRDRAALSQFVERDVVGRVNAWCATFVNAALKRAGVKGTGSAASDSFLKWGTAVTDAIQRGDVLVEPGHHVGFATGMTRMGRGGLEVQMLSGNYSDSVRTSWERLSKLRVRRALPGAAAPVPNFATPSAPPLVPNFSTPAPRVGPPPRQEERPMILNASLHVDGHKIARVTQKHMAQMATHQTSTGGTDSYGTPRSPGTTVLDAA